MAAKLIQVGAVIDAIYQFDQSIHAIEAQLRDAKEARAVKEQALMELLKKQKLKGAAGRLANARISSTKHPAIKNRRAFLKYVVANKAFDLLQNRITSKAYFDRLEEGEEVPGVEVFEKFKVSITKGKRG